MSGISSHFLRIVGTQDLITRLELGTQSQVVDWNGHPDGVGRKWRVVALQSLLVSILPSYY